MALRCPIHDQELVIVAMKLKEVIGGFYGYIKRILRLGVAKCPEFGCNYQVEYDEANGIVIREHR